MKITKMSIKNYRSCKETVFEPHPELTIFIGPNGSGKTNTLSAVRLLGSLLKTARLRRGLKEEIPSTATEIKTWFDWNGKSIIHTAKLSVASNERNEDEILDASETWYMFDVTGSKKRTNLPLEIIYDISHSRDIAIRYNRSRSLANHVLGYLKERGGNEQALEVMVDIANYIENISYYSASQFTNPSVCPISFEVEAESGSTLRRGISIRSTHKELLYDMYLSFKDKRDEYQEFLSIVGPDGIGLIEDIEFKEVKTSSSNVSVMAGGKVKTREKINLLVVPGFTIATQTLSPSQLSEGTFKTLALIFYLVTDRGSMLMIEEPEVCVHHGLLNSVIELLKIYSKEKQIFISTHSDAVLDHISLENVYIVRNEVERGTIVKNISQSMSRSEITSLKEYLACEGSLGEFWKHGSLEDNG